MEDKYITPGNQERGWNDPPQFSYGLQNARETNRKILGRKSGPGIPPMTPPTFNPLAPPPTGSPLAPPPTGSPLAPPPCVLTPPPTCTAPPPKADSSQSEEPDVQEVMSVLNRALTACRKTVKPQVCNEVSKRLGVLEKSWKEGKLSLPVRRRMSTLSTELSVGEWESADELHRSLMVDHVTEVSQWMVGVKRLIAETRKLPQETLRELTLTTKLTTELTVLTTELTLTTEKEPEKSPQEDANFQKELQKESEKELEENANSEPQKIAERVEEEEEAVNSNLNQEETKQESH